MTDHPLVAQLRFTRSEFQRALAGLSEDDARVRRLPLNCISWNVGHLAWQEQRYFVTFAQGNTPLPELNEQFAYGAPASTPTLEEMQHAWQSITHAADQWLGRATTESLLRTYTAPSGEWTTSFGNLLQRVIYHYWYHTGENMAIRQLLGHKDLADFVGDIDDEAPYRAK
ncbi:MAG TPA: DinB family protein [Roseiflexaceae bacterium]|nr:DinB family protein [Roseiflexaceae bacterium]